MAELRGPQGYSLAEKALAELRELGLSPSITNYAVWTTHLSGAAPELSRAIEYFRHGPMRLTDAAAEALYFEHIVSASREMLDLGEAMNGHMRRAAQLLSAAGQTTQTYGDALDGASHALKAPVEPHVLQALVRTLLQATRTMRERTRELEGRLAESSGEVQALQDNLMKAREASLTDPLTSLANRKRFDEFLHGAREDAEASGAPLSLILCDIDNFKRINDTWGHHTGDQVIRFIASALQGAAQEDDLVARYGGEEFAIVLPGASLDEARARAEAVRTRIEGKILRRRATNEHLGHVTASFGIAQYDPGEPSWKLFERADKALYASKEAGRNRVTAQAA